MSSRHSEHAASNRVTAGVEAGKLIDQTIAFVHRHLAEWRDDPTRPDEQSEKKLNIQLNKFLAARARNEFPMVSFHHEEPQTGRRQVDLSASPAAPMTIDARLYSIYQPILVLEGKRLPAPSADREMEYVTGGTRRTGGIQRFKLGLHGADLTVAGMIGYLQDGSLSGWHQVINKWISDLASGSLADVCEWRADESLGPLDEDEGLGVAACNSAHHRSGDSIRLRHLWVVMTHPAVAAG